MKALRTKHEGETTALKVENAKLVHAGKRTKVERQLDDLIAASGVNEPAYIRAVRSEILDRTKIDDDGRATVDTDDLGEMPVGDYLKRFLASDGKAFVSPPKGGGAAGNDRGGTGNGRTITRADFSAMRPQEQAKAMKDGATVIP